MTRNRKAIKIVEKLQIKGFQPRVVRTVGEHAEYSISVRKSPVSTYGLLLGAWQGSKSCFGSILLFFSSLKSL